MKILFIYRKKKDSEEILVNRQSTSLTNNSKDIEIYHLQVYGKTILSYFKLFYTLPISISKFKPEILHVHYGLTIIFVLLVKIILRIKKPVVASFMGADILGDKVDYNKISLTSLIIKKLCLISLNHIEAIIVKSENMYLEASKYTKKEIYIIPNGVDINTFYPIDREKARELLGIKNSEIIILFVTNDPMRKDKNLTLAQEIVNKMKNVKLEIKNNLKAEELNLWYNSCNCLLLTSLSEGSPNVIKEAMATNTPIVSSDVGDVRFLFGDTNGYYISKTYEIDEFIENINLAINFSLTSFKTYGLKRIKSLGIDSESIAKKIKKIYSNILMRN